MNIENLLNETISFAKKINEYLDHKNSTQFYIDIEDNIYRLDKYKFLEKIMYICSRNKIEIPETIGKFLTYNEDLQKDIMYTFLLNSKINDGPKRELINKK